MAKHSDTRRKVRLTVTTRDGKEVTQEECLVSERTEVHERLVRDFPHDRHFYFCEALDD